MSARLLAERGASKEVLEQLSQAVEEGRNLLAPARRDPNTTVDARAWGQINRRFHEILCEAAGNRALLSALEHNNKTPLAGPAEGPLLARYNDAHEHPTGFQPRSRGRRRHRAGAVHLAAADRIEVVQAVPQLPQQHPHRHRRSAARTHRRRPVGLCRCAGPCGVRPAGPARDAARRVDRRAGGGDRLLWPPAGGLPRR
ncbi:hypothetical protein G6F22_015837 [Rhizopus arrhizus]|nr:hypothetical protein G6F22_015837 [Rhizopus arrhizus]